MWQFNFMQSRDVGFNRRGVCSQLARTVVARILVEVRRREGGGEGSGYARPAVTCGG